MILKDWAQKPKTSKKIHRAVTWRIITRSWGSGWLLGLIYSDHSNPPGRTPGLTTWQHRGLRVCAYGTAVVCFIGGMCLFPKSLLLFSEVYWALTICKVSLFTLFPCTSSSMKTKHPEVGIPYSLLWSRGVAPFLVFPRHVWLSESPEVLAKKYGFPSLFPEDSDLIGCGGILNP